MLQAALRADLPVLGICRGCSCSPSPRGGTLVQHLPELVGHEHHRPSPGSMGSTTSARRRGPSCAPCSASASSYPAITTRAWPPRLADRHRVGRRRLAGGRRGPRAPLRPRRALAPRGRRRPAPVRGPRRRHPLTPPPRSPVPCPESACSRNLGTASRRPCSGEAVDDVSAGGRDVASIARWRSQTPGVLRLWRPNRTVSSAVPRLGRLVSPTTASVAASRLVSGWSCTGSRAALGPHDPRRARDGPSGAARDRCKKHARRTVSCPLVGRSSSPGRNRSSWCQRPVDASRPASRLARVGRRRRRRAARRPVADVAAVHDRRLPACCPSSDGCRPARPRAAEGVVDLR